MRVAEFFAGIGLVRMGLEQAGFEVVWANDIERTKKDMYRLNFPSDEYVVDSIENIKGASLPDIELATASFPCTDFSLAGRMAGLAGAESGLFWQFARVMDEMGDRKPRSIMLENVPSFATSNNGQDIYAAIKELNRLGYWCDVLQINAKHFTSQSRPRLFILGSLNQFGDSAGWPYSTIRPIWVDKFAAKYPELQLHSMGLRPIPSDLASLNNVVEKLPEMDNRWWDDERTKKFVGSLSAIQLARVQNQMNQPKLKWATAYRRTRQGKPTWEIRADELSGCLRTAKGGSSKQAVVEIGDGGLKVRWMTAREYARLQGAPNYIFDGISEGRAQFGFGDAVCVPVIEWIGKNYLRPLLTQEQFVAEPSVTSIAYA